MGHQYALPQRNMDGCFASISGHAPEYASPYAAGLRSEKSEPIPRTAIVIDERNHSGTDDLNILTPSMRRPQRFDDVRADGFLLGELQFAKSAVADVVVCDITARVVQKSTDAILWDTSGPTLARVGAPQGVVCSHAELWQVVATYVSQRVSEYPRICVFGVGMRLATPIRVRPSPPPRSESTR